MKLDNSSLVVSARRRALKLAAGYAAGWASLPVAQAGLLGGAGKPAGPVRLALLVGNRQYPKPHDLPPVPKNVRDLKAALEARGFEVTTSVDQNSSELRAVIANFFKQVASAPPDAAILFYYVGHGMQIDAENLLIGSGVSPESKEGVLLDNSAHFQRDVIRSLPARPAGMTMLVLDACRTGLRAAFDKNDGLNQVEAPPGCLIAFSTAAGKPAISPASEAANTFYTASLVKMLNESSGDITFSDLFRKVKADVQHTMSNHPLAAIRMVAQNPFIAENTSLRLRLSPTLSVVPEPTRFDSTLEREIWVRLDQSVLPSEVAVLATQYLAQFPKSRLLASAEVALDGASEAEKALKRNDVRLYKSAFTQLATNEAVFDDARKAARGDKDAAARIARRYSKGGDGLAPDLNRYEGWMQFAAALGNGIACYELAVHYRNQDQPLPASQYEARATELGFTPPPSLDNRRK